MPNPYELTALEDPAEMYDPLPRGAGRIALPSGDVRSFQFVPPSIEDQNEALRAAAARAEEFDRQKREAEMMRELTDDLIQAGKVDDVYKTVEQAQRFQAVLKYNRDFRDAKSRGMDDSAAASYSIMRNLPMLSSGAQSAAMRTTMTPQTYTASTGERFFGVPGGNLARLHEPQTGVPPLIDFGNGVQGFRDENGQIRFVPSGQNPSALGVANYWSNRERQAQNIYRTTPATPEELRNISERRAEAERQLPGPVPQGTPAPAPAPSGPILTLPKNKADLEQGGIYQTPKGLLQWNGERFLPVAAR